MRTKSSRTQTRAGNKQPLNWVIIDIERLRELREDARRRGILPAELLDHDGHSLGRFDYEVIVARAYRAYTEPQARMFAANGGTWTSMDALRRNGQRPSVKFFERANRFVAAELAVVIHWRSQENISWDAKAARKELYFSRGEGILRQLCSTFIPSRDVFADGTQTMLLPEEGAEDAEPRRERKAPSAPTKPVKRRSYRIVDLEEYRNLLQMACEAGGEVHEGTLLAQATTSGAIQATGWLQAVDTYRWRVAGGHEAILPQGRYLPLAETVWTQVVALPVLPAILTRGSLTEAMHAHCRRLRELKQRELILKKQERELLRRDPWGLLGFDRRDPSKPVPWLAFSRRRDPGCDDGQYALLALYARREITEFPVTAHRQRPWRFAMKKRRVKRTNANAKEMRQLGIPWADPRKRGQLLLIPSEYVPRKRRGRRRTAETPAAS